MFKKLESLPKDPTFLLFDQFQADLREYKVNLGIGLYFDEVGNPVVFETVKKAARELDINNFNYLPIGGSREFLRLAGKCCFGESFDESKLAMQATCGGTQACRCFADLAMKVLHSQVITMALPTWVNYYALFKAMEIVTFEHCNQDGRVNVDGYLEAARRAPEGSAFLVQGGLAHNPAGTGLSLAEMNELIDILEEKKMILFMDAAYIGFGEGIEEDRAYIELCFKRLERFAVAVSFSKNASLYEHRCGALFVKTTNAAATETHIQRSIRETISVPPGFGQEVLTNVFKNYLGEWEAEVNSARASIDKRRNALLDLLPQEFGVLRETKGMFGLLPLNKDQVVKLREEKGIYLLENGRINFAGVREADIPYIAEGINEVTGKK